MAGRQVIIEFHTRPNKIYNHVGGLNVLGKFLVLMNIQGEPIDMWNQDEVLGVIHPGADTDLVIPAL